jgi:hypothetical protein
MSAMASAIFIYSLYFGRLPTKPRLAGGVSFTVNE